MRRALMLAPLVLVASCLSAPAPQEASKARLPEGRWSGTVVARDTPDYDSRGEFSRRIVILNCDGTTALFWIEEDGKWESMKYLRVMPHGRIYVLYYFDTEDGDPNGWIESQFWSLVMSTPDEWLVAQSRSVVNQGDPVGEPWRVFQRSGHGTLRFQPGVCQPTDA